MYLNIRHSSAAVRWLCCKLARFSSCCCMVVSSCLMYSVRRSRKAAWACRFRCLRSSDVAYIWDDQLCSNRGWCIPTGFRPPFLFITGAGSWDVELSLNTVALSGSGDKDSESGVRASSKGSCFGIILSLSIVETVTSLVAMDPISISIQSQTNAWYLA